MAGALLSLAPSAFAGTDHYCQGNLPAGWSCAGGNAHTGRLYVEIITNHTGCAALAFGYGGYNSRPLADNTLLVACTSGRGTNGGTRQGTTPAHGAVFNPNSRTTDYIYDAHISY